jgi:hypothetical protein
VKGPTAFLEMSENDIGGDLSQALPAELVA